MHFRCSTPSAATRTQTRTRTFLAKRIAFDSFLWSLLLCLSLALTSCASPVTLTESFGSGADAGCRDESHGVTYLHASLCYEAAEQGRPYGTLKVGEKLSYKLYTIGSMDPLSWLVTEDGNVLHADSVSLPSLADMEPISVRLCIDQTNRTHTVAQSEDRELTQMLAQQYEQGPSIPYPVTSPTVSYKARFISSRYPDLIYTLTYVEYESDRVVDDVNYGTCFLYSAFDRRCVPVGEELHQLLVGAESSDSAATTAA